MKDTEKHYEFTVTIIGIGDSPEKAWREACEAFKQDPGEIPDKYEYYED